MASDGFPENSVCFTTTTITSLGTCDENNKDGEIWKMVEVELVVTNSTGDRVAASEDFTHLEVVFPRFQLGSNIRSSDIYEANGAHETDSEADSGYEAESRYEEDSNSDTYSDSDSEADSEADSGYEDSVCSTDVSETETISAEEDLICEENGRTYHAFGSTEYWGPNDSDAQDQQDLSHHVWKLVLDGQLLTAPVLNPQCILDLGTGTGIWAIDIGDEYPIAHVTGIDVSAIQPKLVPQNVEFQIDDFNAPGYEERKQYDLIHGRELLGSVVNWPKLIEKCYRALKPGGYLDLAEPSIHLTPIDTLPEDHPYPQWVKTFIEAGDKSGMSFDVSSKLEGWMKEAGFVSVEQRRVTIPVGGQTELGRLNQERLHAGVFDFSARRLAKVLGWTSDEITVFVARIGAAIKDPEPSVSQDFYFVHGQKPF